MVVLPLKVISDSVADIREGRQVRARWIYIAVSAAVIGAFGYAFLSRKLVCGI